MTKLRTNDKQGQYILDAMDDIGKSGDAYCSDQTLYYYSRRKVKSLTLDRYRTDKAALLRAGDLRVEGTRIYAKRTLAYEESVACHFADILADGKAEGVELPETLCCGGITLNGQQRAAVDMALRSRLSLILGGAGSGKSTIIRTIVDSFGRSSYVLAVPTGKAARNLRERTGLCAFTVHSALGLIPDSDFLTDKQWSVTGLVVIDEASMVTLEMLAGLLCKVPHDKAKSL